jgi:hypothetical protein
MGTLPPPPDGMDLKDPNDFFLLSMALASEADCLGLFGRLRAVLNSATTVPSAVWFLLCGHWVFGVGYTFKNRSKTPPYDRHLRYTHYRRSVI